MPRAGWVKPESEVSLSDHISIGLLTKTYPPELVDGVVASTERTQLRHRLLPARVVVYYVMALSLYSQASYEEVMRFLVQGLSWLTHWRKGWQVPTKAAIFKSRQRLGVEPMQELFRLTAQPLAGSETEGAWYRGWRVMALDGSCLDVADTEANEIAFGRPGSAREGRAGFPQLRLVGLAECGTHAIVAAAMGPYRGPERELVRRLLPALQPEMLCLADRGLYSFQLWQQAQAQGAALLWRIGTKPHLDASHRFADGSYLAQGLRSCRSPAGAWDDGSGDRLPARRSWPSQQHPLSPADQPSDARSGSSSGTSRSLCAAMGVRDDLG
jgi:hypothetical protein